ncbi:RHS repeat protein [Dyella sp. LX-66]|uniref:RHS repeat-associated core domain-containing protein n=1 Tax=unclassified Dyella TaxID=2634549 RepID=UPI001BE0C5FD|nr:MULTISPECIES: RHS repeat-associated core domain-containing protein [unclassified Dyella]MBT2116784.1 RHS repeat protein [Dyella sp. LX-1]MBT2139036.1 RHS repeat protein [Dyella sp. LX-66]
MRSAVLAVLLLFFCGVASAQTAQIYHNPGDGKDYYIGPPYWFHWGIGPCAGNLDGANFNTIEEAQAAAEKYGPICYGYDTWLASKPSCPQSRGYYDPYHEVQISEEPGTSVGYDQMHPLVAYVGTLNPDDDCRDYLLLYFVRGTLSAIDHAKNLGSGADCDAGLGYPGGSENSGPRGSCSAIKGTPLVGDPINAATGNKFIQEDDATATPWLTFRRFYNSDGATPASVLGPHWRHTYARSLSVTQFSSAATGLTGPRVIIVRPEGQQEIFTQINGAWSTDADIAGTLTETDDAQGHATAYTLFVANLQQFETYSPDGLLQSVRDETGKGVQLTYSTAQTSASLAPRPGLLLTVTDKEGRQLGLAYDAAGNLHQLTWPDGKALTYAYDATTGVLTSVQYPDQSTRSYLYNETAQTGGANLPYALTGIMDESGARFETTTYDASGRATGTQFAGGAGATSIAYQADGSSTTTYPLGATATMSFASPTAVLRTASVSGPCGPSCGQSWRTRTYDTNGYPASQTDFVGNFTYTSYGSDGLKVSEVRLPGSPNQQVEAWVAWDHTLRNPLFKIEADATNQPFHGEGWAYNTLGETVAHCEMDMHVSAAGNYTCATTGAVPAGVRRWTYTYCDAVDGTQCPEIGLLLTATGPRTDHAQTTVYRYYLASSAVGCGTPGSACYEKGDLHTVMDPLGHVTTIASYDANGRITRVVDANGVATDRTYTARGWLASQSVGGAITRFSYLPYGAVKTVTDPDGVTTTYGYDAAHRLVKITDAQGNTLQYTLDAAGNKTGEQVADSSGHVKKQLSRTYNLLGQLTKLTDGLSHAVFNAGYADSYDGNGNLVRSTDALGIQRKLGYDGINRLISTLDNYSGSDTATQNTQSVFVYDAADRLQGVGDPDGLNTTYDHDGLGNATAVHSPDTGTSTYVYDVAGNRIQATDAKGVVRTMAYDALDRLTAATYADSTLNAAYFYDEPNGTTGCANSSPVGRLTRLVEKSVTTIYCYDARGNVVQKRQVQGTQVDSSIYGYTQGDRLASIQTPGKTVVQYTRDVLGRISGVTASAPHLAGNGSIVSNVRYLPFGPIISYTLGNGQAVIRSFDANYALTDVVSPALNLHFARNAMGNIVAVGNAVGADPATETYSYDPLYRLAGVSGPTNESYTYSKAGDRLGKTANGLASGAYAYQSGTHWLATVGSSARTYDANGNTTASAAGGQTYGYGYNGRNRLVVVQQNSQIVGQYTYNALGQRVAKSVTAPLSNLRYTYDEESKVLGEYGTTNRDYIWLDDLPVAILDANATTSIVSYVHADGLNTPRAITDGSGKMLWQWSYLGNPFGEKPPTSSAGYTFNLRFSGQYFDSESGLAQNIRRDYDAATGRYVQSDPMGLGGGVSTFGYAGGDPLSFVDELGLDFFGKCLALTYLGQYGDDAWSHARQDRNRDKRPPYPGTPEEALRNAEHYLYAYQEAKGGQGTGAATLLSVGYAGYKIARNSLQPSSSPFRDDYPSTDEVKSGIEGNLDAKSSIGAPSACGCNGR